jgi:hypothetical protein
MSLHASVKVGVSWAGLLVFGCAGAAPNSATGSGGSPGSAGMTTITASGGSSSGGPGTGGSSPSSDSGGQSAAGGGDQSLGGSGDQGLTGGGQGGDVQGTGGQSASGGAPAAGGGNCAQAGVLDPTAAPGCNFDLSVWQLQEPIGGPGSPTTISSKQLTSGFKDTYFFTDPVDGAMSFWDPENGVTTPNSNFPRCELREMTASGPAANWLPAGTHTLTATLKVTQVPSHVAVGQIHIGSGTPASTKPLLELYYASNGDISLSVEKSPAGDNDTHSLGNVPLGTKWKYVISLSGHTISLTINDGTAQTFAMSPTFDKEGEYFKAGAYDQSAGGSSTVGAKVQFYSLQVFHGP